MKVLFICTGNTCRSPMAEAILRDLAIEHNMEVSSKSAGTHAVDNSAPSINGVIVMSSIGIDISNHKAMLVNEELIEDADLILTMSNSHKKYLLYKYPSITEKVFLINEYAFGIKGDIEDPFGAPLRYYEKARDEIYEAIIKTIEKWTMYN